MRSRLALLAQEDSRLPVTHGKNGLLLAGYDDALLAARTSGRAA